MEILNEKDKQNLRILSRYLRSQGMKYGLIEFEVDYGDNFDMENKNSFTNNWTAEIPNLVKDTLQKVVDEFKDNMTELENYSFNYFEINIDAVDQQLTVSQNFGYYERGDEETIEWSLDNGEDIKEMFNSLDESDEEYDDILTLSYNGSGDSGYIESEFDEGGDVPSDVENFCYRKLESHFGGWEINEGSDGRFIFDRNNKTITLEHANNIERNESDEFYSVYFGK
jgi:hypothetical protein